MTESQVQLFYALLIESGILTQQNSYENFRLIFRPQVTDISEDQHPEMLLWKNQKLFAYLITQLNAHGLLDDGDYWKIGQYIIPNVKSPENLAKTISSGVPKKSPQKYDAIKEIVAQVSLLK